MRWVMSVLVLVAAVGCGGGDGGSQMMLADAGFLGDSAASNDAPSQSGLELDWFAMPAVPGMQVAGVTVTSAKFHVKKLEVIGDAGDPMETTRDDFDLLWSAASFGPPPLFFGSAPPAIYSKVRIGLDKGSSNAPSIEIVGTTVINTTTENFRITSIDKLDLEVMGYNVTLQINGSAEMVVTLKLDRALQNVDWMALPVTNGVRLLDDSRPAALNAFYDDLDDTFTAP